MRLALHVVRGGNVNVNTIVITDINYINHNIIDSLEEVKCDFQRGIGKRGNKRDKSLLPPEVSTLTGI